MSLSDLERHRFGGLTSEGYERFGYNFGLSDINEPAL